MDDLYGNVENLKLFQQLDCKKKFNSVIMFVWKINICFWNSKNMSSVAVCNTKSLCNFHMYLIIICFLGVYRYKTSELQRNVQEFETILFRRSRQYVLVNSPSNSELIHIVCFTLRCILILFVLNNIHCALYEL